MPKKNTYFGICIQRDSSSHFKSSSHIVEHAIPSSSLSAFANFVVKIASHAD